jgi:hypothetical protein
MTMRNLSLVIGMTTLTLAGASCALEPEAQSTEGSLEVAVERSTISAPDGQWRVSSGAEPAISPDLTPAAAFVNRNSFRCLDAAVQSINSNGTKMQLWDCNGGNQQGWRLDSATLGQRTRIVNAHSGRCLDAAVQSINSNGTKMQLWDCNGGDQQLWVLNSLGEIRNAHSGRCLDAAVQSINNNGTTIQLWDCNGGSQQHWF